MSLHKRPDANVLTVYLKIVVLHVGGGSMQGFPLQAQDALYLLCIHAFAAMQAVPLQQAHAIPGHAWTLITSVCTSKIDSHDEVVQTPRHDCLWKVES